MKLEMKTLLIKKKKRNKGAKNLDNFSSSIICILQLYNHLSDLPVSWFNDWLMQKAQVNNQQICLVCLRDVKAIDRFQFRGWDSY